MPRPKDVGGGWSEGSYGGESRREKKFWDASAVIPLCLEEPRTAVLKKVAGEDSAIMAWWATPVECFPAFARLRREGIIRREGEEQARHVLGRLSTYILSEQPIPLNWQQHWYGLKDVPPAMSLSAWTSD